MKKIFILTISLFIAVSFQSCTKDDVTQADEIKINYSVSGKPSFGETRAVKTTWTEGDQIVIFFNPENTGWLVAANDMSKTMKLTYVNGAWTVSTNSLTIEDLRSEGKISVLHHRGNIILGDHPSPTITWAYRFPNYPGADLFTYYGFYSVENGVLDLGEIDLALPMRTFQISVNGLDAGDGWKLGILNSAETSIVGGVVGREFYTAYAATGLGLNTDYGTIATASSYDAAAGVVQNGDDISFWYLLTSEVYVYEGDTYIFELTDGEDTYRYTVDRQLNTENEKTLWKDEAYLLPALSYWTKVTQ